MKFLLSFPAFILGWAVGVYLYFGILWVVGEEIEGGIHIGAGVLGLIGAVTAVVLVHKYGPPDDPPET